MGSGDKSAAKELLPLVYDELRALATARLAHEAPGQTLQPTALVHEAYLRLVGDSDAVAWENKGHFFAAAAEAMRRILVERARMKASAKRGGARRRVPLGDHFVIDDQRPDDLLALDDAVSELENHDELAAKLVKLRFFAGMSHQNAADALGIGRRAADRLWIVAKTWLFERLSEA